MKFTRRELLAGTLLIVTMIGIAYGVSGSLIGVDSNTEHITWTVNCSTVGPVCVVFQSASQTFVGGNQTVTYLLKVLSTQDVSNQYFNTTLVSSPQLTYLLLNGTQAIPSVYGFPSWLNGPYSFVKNTWKTFNFQANFNGTSFGAYDVAVNVVQA